MNSKLQNSRPEWLRAKAPIADDTGRVAESLKTHGLNTVCDAALCPNKGTCRKCGHATVMILGEHCTRGCAFCGVYAKKPFPPDASEPHRVAAFVRDAGLRHVVVTSVTRDDLPDGGARIWAETVAAIRDSATTPATIEILVPDFGGNTDAADCVINTRPDIFGHNLETVPRLYPGIRKGADWARSLALLRRAADAGLLVKTSFMVGLGETDDELFDAFREARDAGARILFVGQYLQPSQAHAPISRYVTPEAFAEMEAHALAMGFDVCAFGPFIRSSFPDERQAKLLESIRNA